MTSGIMAQPRTIICETCGKPALWTGGRRKRYCSQTCRPSWLKQEAKRQRLTPEQKAERTLNQVAHAKRRRDLQHDVVRQMKLNIGACQDCGFQCNRETLPCFAWDHRNPADKAFTIAQAMGRKGIEQIQNEIAKCDLVCHNCHALRTHAGNHWTTKRA